MLNLIKPYLIQALTSEFILNIKRKYANKRRIKNNLNHQITVYLAIDDPYSYLLLQTLTELQNKYQLVFDFRTVLNKPTAMFPAPIMWKDNAFKDGQFLADLYKLNFPAQPPKMDQQQTFTATAQLLHCELQPGFLVKALDIFSSYWQEDNDTLASLIDPVIHDHSECYQQHLSSNEAMLKDYGHYQSAMLHYGGEWYWGIDRLQYLEKRLNDLEPSSNQHILFNQTHKIHQSETTLPIDQDNKSPLVVYWSIRSPYSYIGLLRAKRLAAHFQVPLVVKPVLPMVMRRMLVPKSKRMYILQDVKREALALNIPFGKIADPLGKGVERCYALFEYANANQLGVEFLLTYAQAVWAKGICSETDNGLKYIVEKAGLNWFDAKKHIHNNDWKVWAQSNLLSLYQQNKWGVPSFTYENTTVFGQDRLLQIQHAITSSEQIS
jgi:2-hydroxychromene-2-carboxylate isomerase